MAVRSRSPAGKIKTTGDGAFGLYASGESSTITVTGAPTILTFGAGADGVVADSDGAVSLMNGGTIRASGDGSVGLFVQGGASTITGSGLLVDSPWDLRISSGHRRRLQ